MKYYFFYFVATGFFTGILFSSFIKPDINYLPLVGIALSGILLYFGRKYFIVDKSKKEKYKFSVLILASLIFFVGGIMRIEYAENIFKQNESEVFTGKNLSIKGIVIDEPSRKNDLISFRVKAVSFSDEEKVIDVSTQYVNVRAPFFYDVSYGDEIKITGKINRIKNFKDDVGAPFDYVSYMKSFGVLYEVTYPKIEIVAKESGNRIVYNLLKIKEWFISNIDKNLSEPDASLVSGMVISGKKSLDKELQENFIKTGIIHIVVLSGYNIALVISFLIYIFSFTSKRWRIFFVFAGVLVFIIISGGTAPVVRASVMALSLLILKLYGRQTEALRILFFTAFIMLAINPYLLVFDSSFQLSFLAVFAVMYVSPIVKEKLRFVTEKYKLREIISDTLGVQIFLLPYLVYKMGIISLVALPVNILVLPLVPYVMLLGFAIGVLNFIPYIVFPFALLAHFLVKFILLVVQIFVSIPFSSIAISHTPLFLVLLFYFIALLYLFNLKRKNSNSFETLKLGMGKIAMP